MRTLLGLSALTLAVLVGAALWLLWPVGEAPTAPATAPVTAAREGRVPLGSPVEKYPEDHRAGAGHEAARATTNVMPRGGLAELYAAQEAAAPTRTNGMAELDGEQSARTSRYVYLVASEAAAAALRQLAEGVDQVYVAETDEDAAQIRVGLGLPDTTIIDLRTPTAGAGAPPPDQPAFVDQ